MKKKIVLGTKNKDKLRELQRLLKGSKIEVLSLADFPACADVEETGRTFEANARLKAKTYSRHTGLLTLADDSGLIVFALNGKPGVYSARFAGAGCTYRDNNQKLLKLLSSLPESKRRAKFVSSMALYCDGRPVAVVKGECFGKIAHGEKGANGFGYDPVFVPAGMKKTFAELSPTTKNKISHRGRALRQAKLSIIKFFSKTR